MLKDQKLTIQAQTPFVMIQNVVSEINGSEQIEPEEKIDITAKTGDFRLNILFGVTEGN